MSAPCSDADDDGEQQASITAGTMPNPCTIVR